MSNVEYGYDIFQIGTAILSGLVGTYTTINIIQNIRYCDTFKSCLMFIVISSISLAALSVWTTHFLMLNAMKFEVTIYIKISYTIMSLLFSTISNIIGFWISFMPFLKRVTSTFKEKVSNNKLYQIKQKKSSKAVLSNYEPNSKNDEPPMSRNNIIQDKNLINIRDEGKKITMKESDMKDLDFSLLFKLTKLTRKDYLYMVIGAIFLGPSIMVLHVVGMLAMQIEGEIDFSHPMQILITIIGILASFVINIAFFGPNNNKIKVFLSILITGVVMALHCLSIHFTVFTQNKDLDYSFIKDDGNLITLALGGRIIVGISSSLAYLFKEITNSYIRKSLRIIHDIFDYVEKDEFNYNYVKKYIEFLKFDNPVDKLDDDKKITDNTPVTSLFRLNLHQNVLRPELLSIKNKY